MSSKDDELLTTMVGSCATLGGYAPRNNAKCLCREKIVDEDQGAAVGNQGLRDASYRSTASVWRSVSAMSSRPSINRQRV